MYTKWSQILWNHSTCCTRLRLPSLTRFQRPLPLPLHAMATWLDNELRSLCVRFFSSKISWPHFAISACPRALSLPRKSGMPLYSTVLLIFAKYLSLYLQIFTCTYRGTHTQAHMYNQHTRGIETTRHRSLVERGGRKALLETLHTKKNVRKNPIFTNLKKGFEHIELPAKLLDYFLRSNKSDINQSLLTKNLALMILIRSTLSRNFSN